MKEIETYGSYDRNNEEFGYGLVSAGASSPPPPDDPNGYNYDEEEYVYIFVEKGGKGIRCKVTEGSSDTYDDLGTEMYESPDGVHKIYKVDLSTIEIVEWDSSLNIPNETISFDLVDFSVKATTVMVDMDSFGKIAKEIDKTAREGKNVATLDTRVLKDIYSNNKPGSYLYKSNIIKDDYQKSMDEIDNKYDGSGSGPFSL